MWFKILYFLRIFRRFGYLIKIITEVLLDMRVFLVILGLSVMAFSGTFYILDQNNDKDRIFLKTYTGAV